MRDAEGRQGCNTDKQKRQAEHIEEGYEDRGVSSKTAKARAWATVEQGIGRRQEERLWRGKKGSKSSSKSASESIGQSCLRCSRVWRRHHAETAGAT